MLCGDVQQCQQRDSYSLEHAWIAAAMAPWSNQWSIVGVVKNARMREPSQSIYRKPVNLPVSWSIDRDSLSVCIDMDDDQWQT